MEGESTVMRVSATQRVVTLVLSLPSAARVSPGRAICNLLSTRKCFLSRLSPVSYYASLRIRANRNDCFDSHNRTSSVRCSDKR